MGHEKMAAASLTWDAAATFIVIRSIRHIVLNVDRRGVPAALLQTIPGP
jgi:hypothetical protein